MSIQEHDDCMYFESLACGPDREFPPCDLFEEKHHLLESLTKLQLELIVPAWPKRVLNVGCGTGKSAIVLYNSLTTDQPPKIFAIDTNNYLVLNAKKRYRNMPGLYFILGETDNLESFFHEGFDGIFYTPSLDPIPNFRESIRQAGSLAIPGGVISICHLDGLFTEDGEDAFRKAFPDQKPSLGASLRQEAETIFGMAPNFRYTQVDFRLEAGSEFLIDFLSTPEKSRVLYPKLPYAARIPKIRETCSGLEGKAGRIFMGWKFFIARKESRLDG